VWEPATLGVGQCSFEVGNAPDAIKAIDELFAKYPKSGYTVPACFVAAKAYADVGSKEKVPKDKVVTFNKAVAAMNKARQLLVRDPEGMCKADLQLGEVQLLMGNKDAAAATYVRMLMFRDWDDAKLKPYIEQSFGKAIPLILEKDRNEDVVSLCGTYLQKFPNGHLVSDARKWMGSAQSKLTTSGGAKEAGGALAPVSDSAIAPPASGGEQESQSDKTEGAPKEDQK
jgi:TolA-binding protein